MLHFPICPSHYPYYCSLISSFEKNDSFSSLQDTVSECLDGMPAGTYCAYQIKDQPRFAISFVIQDNTPPITIYFEKSHSGFHPFPNPYITNYCFFESLDQVIELHQHLFSTSLERVLKSQVEDPFHFEPGVLPYQAEQRFANAPLNSYLITKDSLTDQYTLYWKGRKAFFNTSVPTFELEFIEIKNRGLLIGNRFCRNFKHFVNSSRLHPLKVWEKKNIL